MDLFARGEIEVILEAISSLQLYPVSDRGIPNAERIPIRALEKVDLGQYGIMVGPRTADGFVNPFLDNLFWFGGGVINAGDWLLIYTGSGQPTANATAVPGSNVYSLHWGRPMTMFADTNVVPVLFRVNAVSLGAAPENLPQLAYLPPS